MFQGWGRGALGQYESLWEAQIPVRLWIEADPSRYHVFLQQKCNVSILLYKLRLGLFSLPCSGPQSQRTQRTHNAIITTGSLQQKATSATSQKNKWHNSLICMSGATQCKIYVNILNIQDICWYSVFVIHPTIQHGMIGSIHLNIWKGGSALSLLVAFLLTAGVNAPHALGPQGH